MEGLIGLLHVQSNQQSQGRHAKHHLHIWDARSDTATGVMQEGVGSRGGLCEGRLGLPGARHGRFQPATGPS